MHKPFTWAEYFFKGVNEQNIHMVYATFVVIVLSLLSVLVYFKLRKTKERLVPEGRGSLTNIFEVLVEGILRMMEGIIGPSAHKYLPLIGTLFIYIFSCNLLSIVPGFLPPTGNVNTNFACSITVFLYYNYVGVREHGLRYFKHFLGPSLWLAWLILPIELISHIVRPLSLSLRLFGNITGDHMVLEIFSSLTHLFIPILFIGLAVFVAFIQAFVFSLLSLIYIGLATEHEH